MSRFLPPVLILLLCFLLTDCTSNRPLKFNHTLGNENWEARVENDPMPWTRGAGEWFLSGGQRGIEMPGNSRVPVNAMEAKDLQFSNIRVNGDFRVQIYGSKNENNVYVYGPTAGVKSVLVRAKGNRLFIEQRRNASPFVRQVIVRIGVKQLNSLYYQGRGRIEGIRLNSDTLSVTSTGRGDMYLAGHVNLRLLENFGSGNVSIFCVDTKDLQIRSSGPGETRVSGNVGLRSIQHSGNGNLIVIGASGKNLRIDASGKGRISVNGSIAPDEIIARGWTRVYVYGINAVSLHVQAMNYSQIGLQGYAHIFNLEAQGDTYVGARDLCSDEAFVRTQGNAHVNVAAVRKIFTEASGSSSIYFYGPEDILNRFVRDNAFIMRICTTMGNCPIPQPMKIYSFRNLEPFMLRGAG